MIRKLFAISFIYIAIAVPAAASPQAVLTPGWGAVIACYSTDAAGSAYRAIGPRSQWRKVQERAVAACRSANPSGWRACRLIGCK